MNIAGELWFRRAVLGAAAVLLLGLGAVSAVRLLGGVGTSAAASYDLTDHAPGDFDKPNIPDQENAAAWLQVGAAAVKRSDEEKRALADGNFLPYDQWPADLQGAVRASLDRHREGLDMLHRAAGLERSSYGIRYSEGEQARLPELLDLLDAARVLQLEARVALADGRREETLTALATMDRLGRTLEDESTLITALVGIACERMQLNTAAEVVGSGQPWVADGDVLDRLAETVSDADGAETIGRIFDAWTAVMEQHLNDLPADRASEDDELEASLRGVGRAVVADTRAELLRRLATPYGQDPDGLTADAPGTLLDSRLRGPFADLESFIKTIGRLQSVEAQRQLVRAAVAMRREALGHGSYPGQRPSIGDLSRPDPFTGRLLLYRSQPDGSLVLALDGGVELMQQIILESAAKTVVPIHLPSP